ncbi:ttbk family protein kinase; protein serine threon ine kinase [Trichuris trichiura]|uniref:Ttbk family protein kinase protein serine threon ine kinase n=1 Tax=Trichuris trichiura TaxID=36087 RepID=A0A077ZD93_TRITR|nr:ttbk family protein kinase; protein serine threon ine kinase [Trichuris trichiura]
MAINTNAHSKGEKNFVHQQKEPPELPIGSTFGECWKVTRLIGSGGFGNVYEVMDSNQDGKKSSLKVMYDIENSMLAEVRILKKLESSSHGCKVYSWGQIGSLKFIAMTLLGNDLAVLKRLTPENKFSLSTTLRVGCQMVEAIRDVHEIGYIHRDIKPENFAIGYQCNLVRTIYILDFGLARRYRSRLGHVRRPRPCPGFNGTMRYASMYAHCSMEQGRRDDLIAMFYSFLEMYLGSLPWDAYDDDHLTCMTIKKSSILEKLLTNAPKAFLKIRSYLDSLQYADKPDYAWLILELTLVMKQHGYKFDDVYDWETSMQNALARLAL